VDQETLERHQGENGMKGAMTRMARRIRVAAVILTALPLLAGALPARGAGEIPGGSPGALVLTLEEALKLAAEKNRDIGKAREYGNQVQGIYLAERASALPHATLSGVLSRSNDEGQEDLGLAGSTGVAGLDLGITQTLFTWGQIGAAITAAEIGLATAADRMAAARQGTARDVTALFYDILLVKELLALSRDTLAQRERYLDETRKRYAAGTVTEYDILAAEVAVDNSRPEIIRLETLLVSVRERLRGLIGVEGRDLDVRGTLEVEARSAPTFAEAYATAVKNRPELAELRHRRGISEQLVTIARAGDKPRLDFRGGVGYRDVWTGGKEGPGTNWSAGVFASFPFYDGGVTKGRVMQAESDAANLRLDEAKFLDGIALETRQAVGGIEAASSILTALSATVTQAARLLSMAEQGYQLGVKTKIEVDDAQLNLSQARSNMARARRDYLVARVNLAWTTGTLPSGPVKE
jgi:outer membrane protein TolC